MLAKNLSGSVIKDTAAALALVAIGISQANAAGILGINFTDGGDGLSASAIAGAVPQDFFNNIGGSQTPSGSALQDDDGVATAVAFSGNSSLPSFAIGGTPTTPDGSFMKGYQDAAGSPGATLTFTGLNSLTGGLAYSVLVYSDGDTSLRRGQFTLSGATTGNGSFFIEDNGDFPSNGTTANYVLSLATTDAAAEALTGINNYVQFDGVTGDSFTLQSFGTNTINGANRAPINGIQIVTVPEPSTLISLVGSVGILLSRRRRTR